MKKLLNKIRRKKPEENTSRITNETIAEHRERILAGGRRFKYPVQYARHRLVFNAIIIAVAALIVLIGVIWWQLYSVQNSDDFMYRVTKVVPLPVASVDGQPVLFSDYLMKYRSSIHYLQDKEQVSLKTEDGKRQADHIKQEAMQDAEADAYAIKLASQRNITVTDTELQLFLTQQRGGVSESTYDAVILDYYDWSPDEYEHTTSNKLLRQKVSYAIDDQATKTTQAAQDLIAAGNTDLQSVTSTLNANPSTQVTYGIATLVPKTNQDGGIAKAAATLAKGTVSSVIKPTTGDGYYIVKLDDSNDTQVTYEYIHVALTAFDSQLAALKKANKIHEYIAVPTDQTTAS